jgi:hypothetical protein
LRLIRELLDLLSHEVVTRITDTSVNCPVIRGMFGALHTSSSNSDISDLAEAAAFIVIFVKTTGWLNDGCAGLSIAIIDLIIFTYIACSVD